MKYVNKPIQVIQSGFLVFQKIGPLEISFIELRCPALDIYVSLSPFHVLFVANHYPLDHIIRSRPLIGRCPLTATDLSSMFDAFIWVF